MDVSTLLADPDAVYLECFISEPKSITLVVHAIQQRPCCPKCNSPSTSLHSHYQRTVADLPWHGVAIKLELHTRKLRCRNELCKQKVFCERLPKVVDVYARKTIRLDSALTLLAFALGGEAGARAAQGLSLSVGGDTLLRRIRRDVSSTTETPRVLGIDDWAKRKGKSYGTILVDLEKRKPIDLLSDREAHTLALWLTAHPGIEVITRDRSGAYAEGARQGAPQAVQVADRWHLLQNLTQATEKFVNRHQRLLVEATGKINQVQTLTSRLMSAKCSTSMTSSYEERESQRRRAQRYARYTEAIRLHQQGLTQREIARRTGLCSDTVRTYIHAGAFPERQRYCSHGSILDRFLPFLHRRWAEGCHNAMQLWREIKAQGYSGTKRMVSRYVGRLRERLTALPHAINSSLGGSPTPFATPSTKRTAWWLLQPLENLTPEQQAFIEQFSRLCPEAQPIQMLAQEFRRIVRGRQSASLVSWLEAVKQSKIREMINFAAGLRQDQAAVMGALECEWSNGQTEGQVNRLKLLKRQMYGRAKLDLLRARVLHRV